MKNITISLLLPTLGIIVGLGGCRPAEILQDEDAQIEVADEKPSDESDIFTPIEPRSPILLTEAMSDVNDKSIDFSLSLFSKIASENKGTNIALSPFSIAAALSMAAQGAQGQTKEEMVEVLGLGNIEEQDISSYYGTLSDALFKADATTSFLLANSAWTRSGLTLMPSYEQSLTEGFKADIFPLRNYKEINKWCGDKTEGMINNLVGPDVEQSLLVLVNALYFKSSWKNPFKAADNKKNTFHNFDGSAVSTTFMNKIMKSEAYKDDVVRAVSLPFGNMAFNLTVIRPEGNSEDLIEKLDKDYLEKIIAGTKAYMVNLSLPKFEASSRLGDEILTALNSMGIHTAFTGYADFSGITGARDLMISQIGHCVRLKLDEMGAEGAAGTYIGFENLANPESDYKKPETLDINLDKPFIYAITEYSTGAILFIGVQNKF